MRSVQEHFTRHERLGFGGVDEHSREAAAALQKALVRSLPLARVRREAHRARIVAACAMGDRTSALAVASKYLEDPTLAPARRFEIERLVERCGSGVAARGP